MSSPVFPATDQDSAPDPRALGPVDAAPAVAGATSWLGVARACWDMTKARLSSLVVVTAAVGFALGASQAVEPHGGWWVLCGWTLLGTALAGFGANAFNQCLERSLDLRMARTRGRPLPSGRISLPAAVLWAAALTLGGGGLLCAKVNPLSSALAMLVVLLYVGAYTPLKQRTSLNTLVGAVCGAIPPMIGWAGASGGLAPGAWLLFAILFTWQIPHFLAIDWVHRDDYARGGFCMASRADPSGALSGHQVLLYCLALVPISLLAPTMGLGGPVYFVGALALGTAFLALGIGLWATRTRRAARLLFLGSLAYLPLLLGLLVLDR